MTPDAMTLPPHALSEQAITREVLRLIAVLHPLRIVDGRLAIPEDASPELRAKILRFEGELLWSLGKESGLKWGCSWIPARLPEPPWRAT